MVQEVVESEVSLASEVLVPLVLLQRRPSGCPLFTFSSDCSVSPPIVVVGAGSAAVSCAAAGSGGLMEVELCAESKDSPGSSASAFNLPRCPLAANKSCWSVASLGASLRTDLAVNQYDVHISQVVTSCPDANTPLLFEFEHMRSWFSPEHSLKNWG